MNPPSSSLSLFFLQWTQGNLPHGYLQSKRGWCLNVAECETDIIVLDECPTTGCCDNCTNMVFNLDPSTKHIESMGQCVTLDPKRQDALVLSKCTDAPGSLEWTYDPVQST